MSTYFEFLTPLHHLIQVTVCQRIFMYVGMAQECTSLPKVTFCFTIYCKGHYLHIYNIKEQFLCPQDRRSGDIVFVLSAILSSSLKLYLANSFWTVSARALVFHMSIPCDKTFPYVPLLFTIWLWPWSMTHFLKTFEQWVLELWNFIWVFIVIRPFRGYHYFLPSDLDLGILPIFKNL